MSHRVFTQEQIIEAKRLKEQQNYSKRKLAKYFEVGSTTIWENVYTTQRRNRKRYLKIYWKTYKKPQRICIPCASCQICLTREFQDHQIPLNYRIGDKCIVCYMRSIGLTYQHLLEV